MMAAISMQPLSRAKTFAYSCGLFAAGMYFAFNNFTLPLYLSIFTSNNILIGWLSSTRSFEQSIIQPLIGAWSDRTWTRFGRRAPFFLTTIPLVAVLLIINGLMPHDPGLLIWVAIIIFVFSLLFNIGIDPYYALLADVTTSEQRGTVNGVAQVFGFLGQVAILVGAFLLYGVHPAWVFALVAAGLVIGFGIVAFGLRESRRQIHVQTNRPSRRSLREFNRYILELFRAHPDAMKLLSVRFLYMLGINAAVPFLTLFMSREIGLNGWSEVLAMLPPGFSESLAKIDPGGLAQLMAAVLLLSTGIAALPCGVLGDFFGKKRIFASGLLICGVTGLFAAFATDVPQSLFYMILLGIGNAALTVLFFPYLTDLIPAERVGEFVGLSAFAETGGVFISILLAGELINLNLFNLQYRLVFLVTAAFLLLAFIAVMFVKPRLKPVST